MDIKNLTCLMMQTSLSNSIFWGDLMPNIQPRAGAGLGPTHELHVLDHEHLHDSQFFRFVKDF